MEDVYCVLGCLHHSMHFTVKWYHLTIEYIILNYYRHWFWFRTYLRLHRFGKFVGEVGVVVCIQLGVGCCELPAVHPRRFSSIDWWKAAADRGHSRDRDDLLDSNCAGWCFERSRPNLWTVWEDRFRLFFVCVRKFHSVSRIFCWSGLLLYNYICICSFNNQYIKWMRLNH